MKKTAILISLLLCTMLTAQGQVYNQMDADGNITQHDENDNFNPNKRDTLGSSKEVPVGIRTWTVDRRFGDITNVIPDTLTHLLNSQCIA